MHFKVLQVASEPRLLTDAEIAAVGDAETRPLRRQPPPVDMRQLHQLLGDDGYREPEPTLN